jgi:hypothetical protein
MKKFFLFPLVLLVSCDPYSKRLNMQEDADRGKILSDKFYDYVKAGNYSDASSLCGGEATPKAANDLLVKMNADWGNIGEINYQNAKSEVTEAHHHITGEIDLDYTVIYDHTTNDEEFVLKYVNDSLKIAGYHSVPRKN